MGTRAFVSGPQPRAATIRLPRARGDAALLIVALALLIFGMMMLYSASYDYSVKKLELWPTYLFERQLIWLGLGLVVALALALVDYHHWRKLAVPAMLATLVLLLGVLFVNEVRYGASRSLLEGSGQPSEAAKLVVIIYLSVWLYAKRDRLHEIQIGLIPLGIILGLVGGLIYLQPDLSAAATVLILGGLLFFLSGADLRQIIFLLVAALLVGWLVIQFSDTGQQRIADFLLGLQDPVKSSYHVSRALEAIVKGGWFGQGLGEGTSKLLDLPFPATDSIFAVIVEELGFFGALLLTGMYGTLVWRGVVIARRAPDLLGALLAGGVAFWIGVEALINMGVMVGIVPFAGNALPFVSSGGSNLLTVLAGIGILFSVSRQAGTAEIESGSEDRSEYGAIIDLRRRDRRGRVSRPRRLAGR